MNINPKLRTNLRASKQDSSSPQKGASRDNTLIPSAKVLTVEKNRTKQRPSREQWIADAAYFKAEARAFAPDHELKDWLEAENDYLEMLIAAYFLVCEEDGGINNINLQHLAKEIGILNPESIPKKNQLVRNIQKASGHRPCFRSANNMFCKDDDCKWKIECQKLVAEWLR